MPAALEWVVSGGAVTIVAGVFLALHRSSISAYRYVAEKGWRAYEEERAAHDITRAQLYHVLSPLRDTAGSAG